MADSVGQKFDSRVYSRLNETLRYTLCVCDTSPTNILNYTDMSIYAE